VFVGACDGVGTAQLGPKTLAGWTDLAVLRTLQELQLSVGKLQWASEFIADYKAIVAPIEALLGTQ